MGGETGATPSGWTLDTLRVFLERRIDDQADAADQRMRDADKAIQAALTAAEKAVTKAETASEKRFDGVNEFRESLADQQRTMLTRSEYNVAHDGLVERVNSLNDRIAALDQRLTSRLDLGAGEHAGVAASKDYDQRATNNRIIAVGVVISVLVIVVNIVIALITHHP